MSHRIEHLPFLLQTLYRVVDELELMFPGLHFTPDGHMVGSLGEAFSAYYYGVELNPASTATHDGSAGGKLLQVKATQGDRIAIRNEPDHLLVLKLHPDGSFAEEYNGPGDIVWSQVANKQLPSNGQHPISLSTLRVLMKSVPSSSRIPRVREPPAPSNLPDQPTAASQVEQEKASAALHMEMLLRARRHRMAEGTYTTTDERQLKELCSVLLWKHSQSSGKYLGCPYWSLNAVKSFEKHNKVVTNKYKYSKADALRHEHVYPRAQLTSKLLALIDPTLPEVRRVMDEFNIGAVITVEEDEHLEREGVDSDPWERYKAAGVIIGQGPKPKGTRK